MGRALLICYDVGRLKGLIVSETDWDANGRKQRTNTGHSAHTVLTHHSR